MDQLSGGSDLPRDLRRRVDDVETAVASLRLSSVRLSVSANCRRRRSDVGAGVDDHRYATSVRPRILPAFRSRSPVTRPQTAAADTGIYLTAGQSSFGEGRIESVGRIGNAVLCFLGLQEFPPQTGPRSVQPFLRSKSASVRQTGKRLRYGNIDRNGLHLTY